MTRDCRNCMHNAYADNANISDWVSCCHPVTIEKSPRPERGDPLWVDWMTSDRQADDMLHLMVTTSECPVWAAIDPD